MAYVDPSTGNVVQGAQPAWLSLPSLSLGASQQTPPPGNWFTAGLSSGFHGMLSDIGAAGQAVGTVTGFQPLAEAAKGFATSEQAKAQAAARPDLESSWSPAAIGYKITQALPSMAGMIAAGSLVPEAAVPAGLARLGAVLPGFLGGGSALEGAAAAARGVAFGRGIIGAAAAGLPLTIGGNVQAAEQGQGGAPISRGQAAGAIGLGAVEAPLGGLLPAEFRGAEGAAGAGLARRILTGAAVGAPTQAGVAAVQEGLTQLMGDPTRPMADRARDIVNAAMGGGLVGGVFGGAGGVFHRASQDQTLPHAPNEELGSAVDDALGRQPLALPAPTNPTLYAGAAGVGESPYAVEQAARAAATTPAASPLQVAPAGLPAPEMRAQIPSPERMAALTQAGAGPYTSTSSDDLLALHQAYTGRDNLTAAEAGQHAVIREELSRRTAPGLPMGTGNLFTPEEVVTRAPQIDALKMRTLADLPADVADHSFFQHFNAASEPELVNAVKTEVASYGRQPKTDTAPARKARPIPDWLQTVANDIGVMDDGKILASPAEKLEDLEVDRTQGQAILDAARASNSGRDIRAATRDLNSTNAEIDKWKGLESLHQQASLELEKATAPAAPAAAPAIPAPDLSIRPRPKPAEFASIDPKAATKWDKLDDIVRGNYADDVKNRALVHQQSIESGTRITQENIDRLGVEARKEQKGYGAGPDRSYVEPTAGAENAIREPGTAVVDVRQQAGNGEVVGGAHGEGNAAPQEIAPGGIREETSFEKAAREADTLEPNTAAVQPVPEETPVPRAESKTAQVSAAARARLQAVHDAETDPTRKAIAAKALTDTPAAVRKALARLEPPQDVREKNSLVFGKRETPPTAVTEEKGWAQQHADAMNGDVVYEDADHALIRSMNYTGKPIFIPADRALNVRGVVDVRRPQLKIGWLDDAARNKLNVAATKAEATDAAAYQANPDGPFKDTDRTTVGTPSTDPRVVGFVDGLKRSLGLGDVRILIAHPDDVRDGAGDAAGLNGPYFSGRFVPDSDALGAVHAFGPNKTDFRIYIKPGLSDALTVENAAHEVGHIVEDVALRNATPETRAAIDSAFNAFYKKATGSTQQEVIQMLRNRETSNETLKWLDGRQPMSEMGNAMREYFLSKEEWFADQVSRWSTTAEQPRTLIGQFFKSVADKLRDLISYVTGKTYLPDQAVKNFLDALSSRPEEMWRGENEDGTYNRIPFKEQQSRTFAQSENDTKGAISGIEKFGQDFMQRAEAGKIDLKGIALNTSLGWNSRQGIALLHGKELPASIDYANHKERQGAIQAAKDKTDAISMRSYAALAPEMRAKVDQLLSDMQSAHGLLDPRTKWGSAVHADLHGRDDATAWEARHRLLVGELDAVRRGGGLSALEDILSMNQTKGYQRLIGLLRPVSTRWAANGVQLAGHEINPDEIFRTMSTAHDNPVMAHGFYRDAAHKMIDGIQAHIDFVTGEAAKILKTDPKRARAMVGGIDELKGLVQNTKSMRDQIERGTYSPLDHGNGDYFVSAQMVPGHEAAVQDALNKAKFEVGIFHDTDNQTIMSRVDSMSQMERLANVFKDLEAGGHTVVGETKSGHPNQAEGMARMAPKFVQAQIEAINSMMAHLPDGVDDATAQQLKGQYISQLMDLLPDNSVFKSLQERTYASGFDKSMGAAAAKHAANISRASTAASLSPDFAQVMESMRQQVQDAKSGPVKGSTVPQDIARELILREAQQAWHQPHSILDSGQALMHTLMIGSNPAYLLTVTSQIPILLHGELAKKYGYAKSALAIGKAAGRAFNVMKAVATSPDWKTVGFREDSLRKANIPEKDIKTIMALDNAGGLSTYTGQMTDLGEGAGKKAEKYKNIANALGLYGEMAVRVISALSAGDLHDSRPVPNMSREDYVKRVVSDSQFDWGPGQASRMTGPHGALGKYSRIALAFMQFHTHILEKLYSETHALFSGSAAEKKEAGMFLATHLVAVTALAGTLGLPFVGAAAGATDKVAKALTGRDDIDVQGLYRTWLAHTFGFDTADVIAKGLPRALGMDLSKLGDENLLPLTSILADKRKWEDASKDWFKTMSGSLAGEVGNLYLGSRDMLNGDYLLGATKILPEGFKGIAEATYYGKYGIMNKSGERMFTPGTRDIMMAAVGIDPADIAQYSEAQRIRSGLVAQQQYRAQNISQHLSKAILAPGSADLQSWLQQSIQYAVQHPGQPGPIDNLQRSIMQRALGGEYARALNVPLGVQPLNLGMQRATGFVHPNPQ